MFYTIEEVISLWEADGSVVMWPSTVHHFNTQNHSSERLLGHLSPLWNHICWTKSRESFQPSWIWVFYGKSWPFTDFYVGVSSLCINDNAVGFRQRPNTPLTGYDICATAVENSSPSRGSHTWRQHLSPPAVTVTPSVQTLNYRHRFDYVTTYLAPKHKKSFYRFSQCWSSTTPLEQSAFWSLLREAMSLFSK